MTVAERAESETDCVLCGERVRARQVCVRAGERSVCIDCYDNMQDLRDDLAARWWPPLIVRVARRWWRRWAW
jgi:hypothetical protein